MLSFGGEVNLLSAPIAAAASGDNVVVAAVAGKKIVVTEYEAFATGAVAATWGSDIAGGFAALSGAMAVAANGRMGASGPHSSFETARGKALNLKLGGAVAVNGWLTYYLLDE